MLARLSLARHGALPALAVLLSLLPGPRAAAQSPSAPPPAAPVIAPVLGFEASAVTVSGATPEGGVVVFGLGRDRRRAVPRVLRLEHELAADADGALRFELDEPVMAHSVWAAVDLASGEYALASPVGHELERIDFPAQGLGANARFLDSEGRFLDVLLVRPANGPDGAEAAGFWGVAMGDGAGLDADGEANSRLTLDVTRLLALEDSPPAPERLRPKDVLIGVDPQTLRVFATRLADGPDEGNGNPNGGSGNGTAGAGEE